MTSSELVDRLRRPAAFPHPADDLQVHRTHISVVLLAGDFAYKLKKPVELGFVDYGTLERRRHFCDEEVRLNRRLAPEVYLGVVPVLDGREGPVFAVDAPDLDPDEVVEWAVRMRRLPDDRRLLALLERGEIGAAELEDLASHLADFHAGADRGPEIAEYGRYETVAGNARDNLQQSLSQVGETILPDVFEWLSEELEEALATHRPLIEGRADRGVPCDTHGDLRLDHVYFLPEREEPLVIDCIEFNPAFRFADPVADMAFLTMDLRQAGRRDLAAGFSEAYFRSADDDEGRALLDFYVSYRAAVRGKVQGIKAVGEDVPEDERREAAEVARGHWLLALDALADPPDRPGLVLIGGLPATGKSTLAREIADRAGFEVVRSDVVRKELAGLEPEESAAADWESGLYAPDWTERTYEECLRRVEASLRRGERIVVDASFHAVSRRRPFLEVAERLGVRHRLLVCEARPEVVRRRLEARGADASDAYWDVYRRMRRVWEEPDEREGRVAAVVDTAGALEASLARALAELRDAGLTG